MLSCIHPKYATELTSLQNSGGHFILSNRFFLKLAGNALLGFLLKKANMHVQIHLTSYSSSVNPVICRTTRLVATSFEKVRNSFLIYDSLSDDSFAYSHICASTVSKRSWYNALFILSAEIELLLKSLSSFLSLSTLLKLPRTNQEIKI